MFMKLDITSHLRKNPRASLSYYMNVNIEFSAPDGMSTYINIQMVTPDGMSSYLNIMSSCMNI